MAATSTSPLAASSRASRFQLWFGMLGGAIAWSVHIVAVTVTAEWGCLGGMDRWELAGITSVAWMIIGWSVAMLIVAVVATLIAYGNLRLLRGTDSHHSVDPANTSHFMAYVGMLNSGVFAFIILVQSVPVLFYLAGC